MDTNTNTAAIDFVEGLRNDLENLVVEGRGEDAARLIKAIVERTGVNRSQPSIRRAAVELLGDFVDANQLIRAGSGIPDDRRATLRARALSLIEQVCDLSELTILDGGARRALEDQVESVRLRTVEKTSGNTNALRIFISYRRSNSADITGRIHDRLVTQFGQKSVFMDVHDIPIGADFRAHIVGVLSRCSAVLAIIDPEWTQSKDTDGRLRLHSPDDMLRIEIEVAMALGGPVVVPIFVGGATGLSRDDLPDSLKDLSTREGQLVRRDPDFHSDMERLIERLQNRLR